MLSVIEENQKPVETFYHTCLRRILNMTFNNKLRSETIRGTTGQNMLETTVKKRHLRWFGHMHCMEDCRIAK